MKRRPTTQDISWFLDLHAKGQLDLDPPYQRRSVWTPKDRRFFLDTVLRDYPTGPIFLHKTVSDTGTPKFHVVDGKQRLETIIMYSKDELRAPSDYGDATIDNKKFSALPKGMKEAFWNYVLTVEMLPTSDGTTVNQMFDRLNRNARKLTRQELRHARFDGAFCRYIESEADHLFWANVGISTPARIRRMRDVEFVADIFLLVMHGIASGDADRLDQYFAEYDEEIPDFKEHTKKFEWTQKQLAAIDDRYPLASTRYANFADFYTLFGVVLDRYPKGLDAAAAGKALKRFAVEVDNAASTNEHAQLYARAVRGASSDAKERKERFGALRDALAKA